MGDDTEALHGPDYCGEHFECPICGFSHCPVEPATCCPHLLATIEPCEFIDVPRGIPDFSEAVIALVREVESIDIGEERRTIVRTAPAGLKELICLAAEEGVSAVPLYWLGYYDDILTVYWENDDSPAGGARYDCFHPDPQALARKIKEDAERALAWVTEYLENKSEEEEASKSQRYDDKDGSDDEDDEDEEWR